MNTVGIVQGYRNHLVRLVEINKKKIMANSSLPNEQQTKGADLLKIKVFQAATEELIQCLDLDNEASPLSRLRKLAEDKLGENIFLSTRLEAMNLRSESRTEAESMIEDLKITIANNKLTANDAAHIANQIKEENLDFSFDDDGKYGEFSELDS